MDDPSLSTSDRPIFDHGQIVCSNDGTFAFRVIERIGEGRCCLVYLAKAIRDGTKVALKAFKRGPTYEGAIQRERFILDSFSDPKNNLVLCCGSFFFNGLYCQVMELLDCNVRQLIYRNDRQGLPPWITQKFARDLLMSLLALHENRFVHADLKPANVMWSGSDGCFKLLDFGLTFHTEEADVHQIQSSGYKAPEASNWNKFKEEKRRRKRKLQGTYNDLSRASPAYVDGLNELDKASADTDFAGQTVVSRKQIPCEFEPFLDRDKRLHECDRNESATSSNWPSASSGIFTASSPATASHSRQLLSLCGKTETASKTETYSLTGTNSDSFRSNASSTSGVQSPFSSVGSSVDPSLAFTSCAASRKLAADDSSQEWRRGRAKKREAGVRKPPRSLSTYEEDKKRRKEPGRPDEKVDIWSFGCLLVEVISGHKMFSASDKMAGVLKPLQLLDMRIGETEIKYHSANQQSFFSDAKNLIQRCLSEDPNQRISARSALNHSFFTSHNLMPSLKDMVLLPSNVLQLLNVMDDRNGVINVNDGLKDILREAEKHSAITDVKSRNGHLYMEFQEASDCRKVFAALRGKVFDEKTVVAVFYPVHMWTNNVFV